MTYAAPAPGGKPPAPETTDPENHHPDGPLAAHALTIKLQHAVEKPDMSLPPAQRQNMLRAVEADLRSKIDEDGLSLPRAFTELALDYQGFS